MRLSGKYLREIGDELGVSQERARQMVVAAERRLAYRVFCGIPLNNDWKWSDSRWISEPDWKKHKNKRWR
jgi:hypothetical protein